MNNGGIGLEIDKTKLAQEVVKYQNGDGKAFETIYNMTNRAAYFTALKIVKNEDDAQDIVQDSYVKVLEKLTTLREPETFMSWFNMIVANTAKNSLAKSNPSLFADEETETFVLESIPEENREYVPESSIEKDDLCKEVVALVDGLSDEKRTAVMLYYYDELTTRQIAESLGINENTVKSRLFQARKDLARGVDELEKKNKKLLGVAPIPLVIWALKHTGTSASAAYVASGAAATTLTAVTATAGIGSAAGTAAAGSAVAGSVAAGTAGGIGAKIAGLSLIQKIIAAAAAVAIVAGAAEGTAIAVKNRSGEAVTVKKHTGTPITVNTVARPDISSENNKARTGEYGPLSYVIKNNEVTITYCENYASGRLDIPKYIEGLPVRTLREALFRDNDKLTEITIPDSVTDIGYEAFAGCTGLKEITIPDSVTDTGDGIFAGCTGLESVKIGSGIETLNGTFSGCTGLKEITIPDSVTDIGGCAFLGCSSLEKVTIGRGVKTIGYRAFGECTALTGIVIPDGVTDIKSDAFKDCTTLTDIFLPDSVTSIDISAFTQTAFIYDDSNRTNGILYINNCLIEAKGRGSYEISHNTSCIADGAFIDNNYESITVATGNQRYYSSGNCVVERKSGTVVAGCKNSVIPNDGTIKKIGIYAFCGCKLEEATVPGSVTDIEEEAFSDCHSLRIITLPDSVRNIGRYAFSDTAYYNNESNWENGVLYIGNHLIEVRSTVENCVIKPGTLTIAENALQQFSQLKTLVIPGSVSKIGRSAFFSCYELTDVYYAGSEADRQKIEIGDGNGYLENATWHYNAKQ